MLCTVSAHRVSSAEVPEDVALHAACLGDETFSSSAPAAKLRAVTELYLWLVGSFLVIVGGVLGAFVEPARARSGYLAKEYHDLLTLLFALEHSASDDLKAERQKVLDKRSHIEAAVSLFWETEGSGEGSNPL